MTQALTTTTSEGASLIEIYRRIRARAAEARAKRLERAGLREMLTMDDHVLRDIGVTRGDVRFCAALPQSEDASATLWRLSMRNPAARKS